MSRSSLDLPGTASRRARRRPDFAAGILLRAYNFDKYKTKKDDADGKPADQKPSKFTIHCADPAAAKKAFADAEAVADGVVLARDLVNEPANMLGPVEFAAEAKALEKLGVKVEILTEKEMKKLGMGALLGVAQGSRAAAAPGRHAVERRQGQGQAGRLRRQGRRLRYRRHLDQAGRRHGGHEGRHGRRRRRDRPDACARRAQGQGQCRRHHRPVENMVDGNAQRPGDIVTSMSGQTIEVLNTDAEGRLVLADALWYCNERFEPKFMVNLATLTGAIMVALGQQPCRPVLQQ